MRPVRKAVIPVAGYGSNFLPATKAFAKEMLPIVDKPIIQFIVEEALESGIEEIIIVSGGHKRPIEDHFDSNVELEVNLEQTGKWDLLEIAKETTASNIYYVRQSSPTGLGDAVQLVAPFVGDEPFAVLLGDVIMQGEEVPGLQELMDAYSKTGKSQVGVTAIEASEVSQRGVVKIQGEPSDWLVAEGFVEKPRIDEAPSQLGIAGRYILTQEIFDELSQQSKDVKPHEQLTEALNSLAEKDIVYAKTLKAYRYDVGNRLGYMRMNLHYGLTHEETAEGLQELLIEYSKKLS